MRKHAQNKIREKERNKADSGGILLAKRKKATSSQEAPTQARPELGEKERTARGRNSLADTHTHRAHRRAHAPLNSIRIGAGETA